MKIMIVDTDYPTFTATVYREESLKTTSYEQQRDVRRAKLFGISYFFADTLKSMGHDTQEIYFNNEFIQKAWLNEHPEIKLSNGSFIRNLFARKNQLLFDIFEAQIKQFKPDVLINQAMLEIDPAFFKKVKSSIGFLVGQHAQTPLKDTKDWLVYDVIISSQHPTLEAFKKRGIPSEYFGHGFYFNTLKSLVTGEKKYDISFVGSFVKGIHDDRIVLYEELCRAFPNMNIWTPSELPKNSPIAKINKGEIYGKDMFQALQDSKIVLNHHGMAQPHAGNMRLFEVTGVGSLLITDYKNNLRDIFDIDKEVVVYNSTDECIEKIKYYLEHEDEREQIATAGHEKTFTKYSYECRMNALMDIIQKHKKV